MNAQSLESALKAAAEKTRAEFSTRFFRTAPGEYSAGDIFLGASVPVQRAIAKAHKDIPVKEIEPFLTHKIHEYRLTGFMILIEKYQKDPEIYKVVLKHIKGLNNWDLVDLVAPAIIGKHLLTRPRDLLYDFARSGDLWKERIAIVSTLMFIRNGQFADTIRIAKMFLGHKHHLIHKATGWMLREVGKKDKRVLLDFLANHAHEMPSVMRSYAMEHLPKTLRTTIRKEAKLLTK